MIFLLITLSLINCILNYTLESEGIFYLNHNEPTPPGLITSPWVWGGFHKAISSPGWTNTGPSASPYRIDVPAPTQFKGLCRNKSNLSESFLDSFVQNWILYFKCCLTDAGHRACLLNTEKKKHWVPQPSSSTVTKSLISFKNWLRTLPT